MSTKKTIAKSFTVSTIEDGVSVQAQYAPNANPTSGQIHTVWQEGDLYMRTRESDESTWSSWHKIVGESGDETEYSFNISKSKTSTNSTTAPSDCYYTNWQDAPVAPTSTYPYMWMKIVKKTWNESTQSYDSGTPSYARVTGEKGDGAPIAFADPEILTIQCYSNGNVKASSTTSVIFSLKVANNSVTVSSVTSGTKPTGVTVTGVADNAVTITVGTTATASGLKNGVTFTVNGSYGGKTYSANVTVALIGAAQGDVGARGKVGRFFYYAGIFNASDTTTQFIVNDAQSPFFEYTKNNQKRYAVYNPENNPAGGSLTMSKMTPLSGGLPDLETTGTSWEIMTNDFKYLITEAIFADFAKLGSFVISGDWMLSTNGKINGTDYNDGAMYNGAPAYTWFDPAYPNVDHTKTVTIGGQQVTVHNFIPNFCVDGLTGETYQQNAHIKGEIIATSGSFTGVVHAAMMYGTQLTVNNPNTSVKKYALDLVNHPANLFMCDPDRGNLVIVLPQAGDYDGITIRFFADGVTETGTSPKTVTLQTYNSSVNLYFKDMDNYVVGSWQYSNAMKMLNHEPYEASAINGVWYITQGIGKYGTYVS